MPNHVWNQLVFKSEEIAGQMFAEIAPNGKDVDFNTLIPTPLHIYQESIGAHDEMDFKENTWSSWNRANWNTKWNAYETQLKGRAIEFQTAWSPPYPFAIAVANKFGLDFRHTYICEYGEYWGEDTWKGIKRISRMRDNDGEFERIFIQVYGEDELRSWLSDYQERGEEWWAVEKGMISEKYLPQAA